MNPLAFVTKYALVAALALAGVGWLAAGVQTYRLRGLQLDAAESLTTATETARLRERVMSIDTSRIRDEKDAEIRRVADERDRALAGLRNRPKRLPDSATGAGQCDGATGKQLSRDDAEFLVGFASERDEQAAQLRECQAWIRAVTQEK